MWDLRATKRPQFVIRNDQQISGFEWALYRQDLLATYHTRSEVVKFWDLHQ